MTLDLFHANIEEPDIAAAIHAAGSRLWHVHVADSNRRGLGRGHLDLPPIAAALLDIGYTGAVVLEIVPPEGTAGLERDVREAGGRPRPARGPRSCSARGAPACPAAA